MGPCPPCMHKSKWQFKRWTPPPQTLTVTVPCATHPRATTTAADWLTPRQDDPGPTHTTSVQSDRRPGLRAVHRPGHLAHVSLYQHAADSLPSHVEGPSLHSLHAGQVLPRGEPAQTQDRRGRPLPTRAVLPPDPPPPQCGGFARTPPSLCMTRIDFRLRPTTNCKPFPNKEIAIPRPSQQSWPG